MKLNPIMASPKIRPFQVHSIIIQRLLNSRDAFSMFYLTRLTLHCITDEASSKQKHHQSHPTCCSRLFTAKKITKLVQ